MLIITEKMLLAATPQMKARIMRLIIKGKAKFENNQTDVSDKLQIEKLPAGFQF